MQRCARELSADVLLMDGDDSVMAKAEICLFKTPAIAFSESFQGV